MKIIHLEILNKKELKKLKSGELNKLWFKMQNIISTISIYQDNVEGIETEKHNQNHNIVGVESKYSGTANAPSHY